MAFGRFPARGSSARSGLPSGPLSGRNGNGTWLADA
jgi:hypothetical protein